MTIVVSKRGQKGVNLIEVMVAMVIGLFLVLGATTLYVRSKRTADQDDAAARLQETARYALSVLETDVRMANYFGLTKDGSYFSNLDTQQQCTDGTQDCANSHAISTQASGYCGASYVTNVRRYLEGTNNQYSAALPCPADHSAIMRSSDSITIRRAGTQAVPASTTRPQVCSTRSAASRLENGAACPAGQLHNLIMNLYYVSTRSDSDSNVPSLRRIELQNGPTTTDQEIVSGVEDLQIQFVWDSNFDPGVRVTPAQLVNADNAVLDTGRIVAVKVWLLIRSDVADTGYRDTNTYSYADRTGAATASLNVAGAAGKQYAPNDGFHRLLVSRTIFVRNVTGT